LRAEPEILDILDAMNHTLPIPTLGSNRSGT
jgi:hypothetical protein